MSRDSLATLLSILTNTIIIQLALVDIQILASAKQTHPLIVQAAVASTTIIRIKLIACWRTFSA